MKNKKTKSKIRVWKILLCAIGAVIAVLGFFASFGALSKVFKDVLLFEKWESLAPWWHAVIMLSGLTMMAVVLNGVESTARDRNALTSRLIRRPIQRWFPVFLLPTFAAFCLGFLYPFLKGLFLSFCDFKTTSNWSWAGLKNYVRAFEDSSFLHAFWYTALFALVSLIIINGIAFMVAFALTRGIRHSNLFRTVFFMPNLIGGIVLGYIWSMIFDGFLYRYNTSVVLNTKFGFWGLVILMCWQQIGYMMIIYIAGIESVSDDIVEAAKIDGASGARILRHIIIPNVMPSITICTFLTLTNSFKLFDQNLALTAGRPFKQLADGAVLKTTEMMALNIYSSFYENLKTRGIGQAKSVLFFILVAAISIIQLSYTRRKEVQQ